MCLNNWSPAACAVLGTVELLGGGTEPGGNGFLKWVGLEAYGPTQHPVSALIPVLPTPKEVRHPSCTFLWAACQLPWCPCHGGLYAFKLRHINSPSLSCFLSAVLVTAIIKATYTNEMEGRASVDRVSIGVVIS